VFHISFDWFLKFILLRNISGQKKFFDGKQKKFIKYFLPFFGNLFMETGEFILKLSGNILWNNCL